MTGDWLTQEFEQQRPHLQAVAYRMLGSLSESEDAVQEAWIRLDKNDAAIDNLGGWLTTVVARISLDMLRARSAQREDYVGSWLPEPVVTIDDSLTPEQETLIADSVGLALLVVLETLTPGERLAFVLHDMFAVPFDEIARIVDRSPDAARQLASRGRRRVQGEHIVPDADRDTQRHVVDAFMAASRDGDFEALLALLDPDVVLRADMGRGITELRGAEAVLGQARMFSQLDLDMRPALINGAVGAVAMRDGKLFSVGAITLRDGRIATMDFLADPERLRSLDLAIFGG